MMTSAPVNNICLNGEQTSARKMEHVVAAICDPDILVEKGGFIFSVQIAPPNVRLGLVPYQIAGERQYHYHLELPENDCTLTGFFGANGRVEILIKIPTSHPGGPFTPPQVARYRTAYIDFAQFLLAHGFLPNTRLEETTRMMLTELGCFEHPPATIGELAGRPAGNEDA